MWKRDNEPNPAPTPAAPPAVRTERTERVERTEPEPQPYRAAESSSRAVIGASLDLQGELSGDEDLLIEGRVQGRIQLSQHAVTIGAKGRVSAGVHARLISIEGEVDGNLVAEEMIVLKKSARVRGDLVAPRVVIEDGARFKGTIDMEPAAKPAQGAGPRPLGTPAQAALPTAGASTGATGTPVPPAAGTAGGSKAS